MRSLILMKDEYDFSSVTDGKFYRKGAIMDLPVYLDPEVRGYLAEHAKAKGHRGQRGTSQ